MSESLALIPLILLSSAMAAQSFTGSFELVASQRYPNGNLRQDSISYAFSDENTALVLYGKGNQPDLRLIFDTADSTITGLFELNGKKGGYILPMDEDHWPGMDDALTGTVASALPVSGLTGKQREIAGYQCREVVVETPEYTVNLWVTKAIPLTMTQVLAYQSVGKGKSEKETEMFKKFGISAFPLEMELHSKEGKADVLLMISGLRTTIDPAAFEKAGHQLLRVD